MNEFVRPFYGLFLHGNCLADQPCAEPSRTGFQSMVTRAARAITPETARTLLQAGWREAICAAWFIGIRQWAEFLPQMREAFLASEMCYAGQGYCVALACLPSEDSASALREYLGAYLPRPDLHYDQGYALGALLVVDEQLGRHHTAQYLDPGGAWEQWAAMFREPLPDVPRRDEIHVRRSRLADSGYWHEHVADCVAFAAGCRGEARQR